MEKIILGRIRIKAWDDVERKVKPTADPFEFKKKLVLEQDKSKKSLAEIYEEVRISQWGKVNKWSNIYTVISVMCWSYINVILYIFSFFTSAVVFTYSKTPVIIYMVYSWCT